MVHSGALLEQRVHVESNDLIHLCLTRPIQAAVGAELQESGGRALILVRRHTTDCETLQIRQVRPRRGSGGDQSCS
jgi:hypothetical protein